MRNIFPDFIDIHEERDLFAVYFFFQPQPNNMSIFVLQVI